MSVFNISILYMNEVYFAFSSLIYLIVLIIDVFEKNVFNDFLFVCQVHKKWIILLFSQHISLPPS